MAVSTIECALQHTARFTKHKVYTEHGAGFRDVGTWYDKS